MMIGCGHTIHSREHHFGWDRDNEPKLIVAPGESVEFNIVDTGGGEITPNSTVDDLDRMDHTRFAPLTGPICVDGAVPGDALKITMLDLAPSGWGWSMVTPRYGILADEFDEPLLHIWRYDPSTKQPAVYKDIAHVPIKPFPGIIGLSPGEPGTHSHGPPRNIGGNLDMRDISTGVELYLPVEVPGGLLSLGDTHAAQGHGELAGTALESPIDVALQIDLVKQANLPGPRLITPGPVARHLDHAGYFVTCGVETDLVEAARAATRHMIELLGQRHQISPIDAYLLCSVCGDLCISEMVNKPVNVVSLYFPRAAVE
jgi:acetamidase/formamidase